MFTRLNYIFTNISISFTGKKQITKIWPEVGILKKGRRRVEKDRP